MVVVICVVFKGITSDAFCYEIHIFMIALWLYMGSHYVMLASQTTLLAVSVLDIAQWWN